MIETTVTTEATTVLSTAAKGNALHLNILIIVQSIMCKFINGCIS